MSPTDLARLIDAYGAALVLYARQWCAVPEDVVQESFVKLAVSKPTPTDAPAWLYRVVRHAAIDAGRTARRRVAREEHAARNEIWFQPDDTNEFDVDVVRKALESIPADEREIIVSHLWGGLRFDQIADLTGCSASTAHRRYSSGIERLRQILEKPCPIHSNDD